MITLGGDALTSVRSVLFIGAHADDIELGCGSTVLTLARRRPDLWIRWVVMSGRDERAAEARASGAAFLGNVTNHEIVVNDFRDSFFPADYERLKHAVRATADGFDPDLVFTHRQADLHQDHRLISELTWNTFRNHMILEYEISKYDGDLGQPNVFVTADRETVDRKCALLHEHFPSQHGRDWFDDRTFRSLMRLRGVECRASDGYAEGFHARKLRLL